MSAAGPRAISGAEANDALAPLLAFDAIVIAVSGGPDSMALMHLVAEWRSRQVLSGKTIVVATIDHGLRPEGEEEAAFVARAAAGLGLAHRSYVWSGEKPSAGVPAAARAARYQFLEGLACSLSASGPVAVVTAHTEDDQAETLIMRLKRGAGIDGLSAMAPARPLSPGSRAILVRPLLAFAKARLVASLEARGVTWIEDPTNQRLDLERARTRKEIAEFEKAGLSRVAIARSARRLRQARDAIAYADTIFAERVALSGVAGLYAELDGAAFGAGPRLLRERVLTQLIERFGGTTPAPQLSEVEELVERLERTSELRATLGGTVISRGARKLRIWREAGRIDPGDRTVTAVPELWDDRFWVSTTLQDRPIVVRPLQEEGWRRLALDFALVPELPAGAAAALPAFWSGDDLIGIPLLAPFAAPKEGGSPLDLTAAGRVKVSVVYQN